MSKQKIAIIAAAVAVALLILFFPKGPKPVVGKDIQLSQDNGQGQLTVNYVSHPEEIKYLNAAIDLNGDGRIGIIQSETGALDEWLIINQEIQPEAGETGSFQFEMPDQFGNGSKKVMLIIGDEKLPSTSWPRKPGRDFSVIEKMVEVQ